MDNEYPKEEIDCDNCGYALEDGTCGAFECNGTDCPELPCEIERSE